MDFVNALFGWGMVVIVIATAVTVGGLGILVLHSSKPLERKYLVGGGGLAGGYSSGLEAVFSPTAHEAGIELDRMTKRSAPAPMAGDPPWAIDGDRIRIDV